MPKTALKTISSPVYRRRPSHDKSRSTESLCTRCSAKCCRYFALGIDTPTDQQDFDHIRWYLLHERAAIFVDEGSWFLLVENSCKHLGEDNQCGIYESRPQICRDYTTAGCEYDEEAEYEQYWDTPEQIEEYAKIILGRPKAKPCKKKSAKRRVPR